MRRSWWITFAVLLAGCGTGTLTPQPPLPKIGEGEQGTLTPRPPLPRTGEVEQRRLTPQPLPKTRVGEQGRLTPQLLVPALARPALRLPTKTGEGELWRGRVRSTPGFAEGEQSGQRMGSTGLSARRADCGPRALAVVLEARGRQVEVSWLARAAGTNRFGTTLAGLERAAEAAGLRAEAVQMDLPALRTMEGMGIAWVDGDHYAAVMSIRGDEARIHDPNQPAEETISTARLLRRSGGIVLTLER